MYEGPWFIWVYESPCNQRQAIFYNLKRTLHESRSLESEGGYCGLLKFSLPEILKGVPWFRPVRFREAHTTTVLQGIE